MTTMGRPTLTGGRLPGAVLLLLALWSPAAGQDLEPAGAPDSVMALEPVVVRVLRWPMAVARSPVAVSVVEPELRAPPPRLGLGELLPAVPGLQVQNRYNPSQGDRIIIRGFGARAQFGIRGVEVLVDGIPATMPDGQSTLSHLDLTELARAEVVRGPASVLYGNAAGGALLLETRSPPVDGRQGEVEVVSGSGGLLRVGGSAAGAGAAGRWRVALTRSTLDGFRSYGASESWKGTGTARTALAGGELRVSTHLVRYDAENPGSLTAEQFAADPTQAQERNVVQGTGEAGRHGQAGVVWRRALGGLDVEVSSHLIRRVIDNPIPPAVIDLERTAGGAGVRVAGRRSGASWSVGAEAAGQWDDRLNHENVEGRRGVLTLDQREEVANLAAYAQLLVPVMERVRLFGAARWDGFRFTADDALVTPENPDDSGDRTMTALSPSLGVNVEATEGLSLFASVGTAFQTPTTTELVNRPDGAGGLNPELEPQRTVSVEVGARGERRWHGARLSGELVAFRAAVEDALVPFELPDAPGRSFFRNAAAARHTGLEAAAALRRPGTEILASATAIDAVFEEYAVDGADYSDLEVPGIRPWVAELAVRQELAGYRVALDWEAAGAMPADDANAVTVDGYTATALSVSTPPLPVGPVRLSPYAGVENLFDARYAASVVVNAFGGRYYEPAPGRVLYVGLRSRF